ncbi:MAG: PEP-CTERM sorting domain-containing protein [Verrucomicrobiaceae bacterium]
MADNGRSMKELSLVLCTLIAVPSGALGQAWTDWTSVNGSNDQASGTLLINNVSSTVNVFGCVAGTVTDGTSTVFADGNLFSPTIATGDALRTDHVGNSMGDFVITFSNPITNPVFHMAGRHHYSFTANDHLTSAAIKFEIESGNLGYGNPGQTSLKRADWTIPFIQGGDSNGEGTTADGTFHMVGTFTQIRLGLPQEDFVYFQIGDDNWTPPPVPEPSSGVMMLLGAGLLVRRRR